MTNGVDFSMTEGLEGEAPAEPSPVTLNGAEHFYQQNGLVLR
ncbi:MAG: hypothetical protein RMM06_04790 [Armatimonadota bacterium]|nr:hypothetical protein [bacterium]MDW8290016.1 hypothetical protein [Armatimonadota bacterium]